MEGRGTVGVAWRGVPLGPPVGRRLHRSRPASNNTPPVDNTCVTRWLWAGGTRKRGRAPEGLRDGFDALCGVSPWVKSHFGWLWQLEFCVLISRVYVDFMHNGILTDRPPL